MRLLPHGWDSLYPEHDKARGYEWKASMTWAIGASGQTGCAPLPTDPTYALEPMGAPNTEEVCVLSAVMEAQRDGMLHMNFTRRS
eukprot:433835-Pelagomonas_calceolata.AAC.4